MSSILDANKQRATLLTNVGKAGLNVQFPDEFEVYVMALELIDSLQRTVQYFIFPINPSSFDETRNEVTSVKKTLGGVSVLSSSTFTPGDINLNGNFGRSFKILIGGNTVNLTKAVSNTNKQSKNEFSQNIKTGYGCCKILQSIVDQSKKADSVGGTYTLIFHNLALGNSYVIKAMSLRFNMSLESNMIWNYTLALKSIAPLSSLYTAQQLEAQRAQLTLNGYIQSALNNILGSLNTSLQQLNIPTI